MQIPTEEIVNIEPLAVRYPTAAKILDCSTTTIWKLTKAGVLKTVKVASDDRILVSSIKNYITMREAA